VQAGKKKVCLWLGCCQQTLLKSPCELLRTFPDFLTDFVLWRTFVRINTLYFLGPISLEVSCSCVMTHFCSNQYALFFVPISLSDFMYVDNCRCIALKWNKWIFINMLARRFFRVSASFVYFQRTSDFDWLWPKLRLKLPTHCALSKIPTFHIFLHSPISLCT
jgi:hypothetical protein